MTNSELDRIAGQYRADGYDVIVHPAPDDLPDFLRSHPIDMLARKDNESVVVAARKHSTDVKDDRLMYLAAEINARPGWRMDLVVTNGDGWKNEMPPGAAEPTDDEIRSLVRNAEHLLRQGQLPAALMLAWSAVEAALRAVARRMSIPLESKTPRYVLETLTVEGVLSRDQYEHLNRVRRIRNALANGLTVPAPTAEIVQSLITTACEVLDLEPSLTRE